MPFPDEFQLNIAWVMQFVAGNDHVMDCVFRNEETDHIVQPRKVDEEILCVVTAAEVFG